MASTDDLNSTAQGIVRNLGLLVTAMQNLAGNFTLAASGSFTLAATAANVVPQTAVQTGSIVTLTPTNAAAATLQSGVNAIYVSAKSAGVSFTVTSAVGTPVGTELFSYVIVNPVS